MVIRGEFNPGKENINKQIKMPDSKHKTFEEVTKLTGMSGVGRERIIEVNCRKSVVNWRVRRIRVVCKLDDEWLMDNPVLINQETYFVYLEHFHPTIRFCKYKILFVPQILFFIVTVRYIKY